MYTKIHKHTNKIEPSCPLDAQGSILFVHICTQKGDFKLKNKNYTKINKTTILFKKERSKNDNSNNKLVDTPPYIYSDNTKHNKTIKSIRDKFVSLKTSYKVLLLTVLWAILLPALILGNSFVQTTILLSLAKTHLHLTQLEQIGIAYLGLSGVFFLLHYLSIYHFKHRLFRSFAHVNFKTVFKSVGVGLLISCSQIAYFSIATNLHWITSVTSNQQGLNRIASYNAGTHFFIVLSTLCLAPICEELIYRALAFKLGQLVEFKFKTTILTLLTALVFALAHQPSSLAVFGVYFIPGMLLSYWYSKKGLAYSSVAHSTFNLLALLLH